MIDIDQEMEAFNEEDIVLIISLLDKAIRNKIDIIEKAQTLDLEDIEKKVTDDGDKIMLHVMDAIRDMAPGKLEQHADNAINNYVQGIKKNMETIQVIITKLYLLKSRI